MAKVALTAQTGLSAQTVSVIMRALEADGLIEKGTPQRGKVGQPSVPMRLRAEGAFFLGLKIGRRSTELILVDFLGQIAERAVKRHDYPQPDDTIAFVVEQIARFCATGSSFETLRLSGLGIALPFQLWNWARMFKLPRVTLDAWASRDIRRELQARLEMPVYLENDASCASNAELVFGKGEISPSFLHIYLGYFIGGGLVQNGQLYTGPSGNAAAIGSIPVWNGHKMTQLIDVASLAVLEDDLRQHGQKTQPLWEASSDWPFDDAIVTCWRDRAASGIAAAIAACVAVTDITTVLIDGWMPAQQRRSLTQSIITAIDRLDWQGLRMPQVFEGRLGRDARVLGAASLPLAEQFLTTTRPLEGTQFGDARREKEV